MPPEQRDAGRIWDMIETARLALRSLQGSAFAEFTRNMDLRDAALYRIQRIGEAASQISPALKARRLEVPWRDIVDMRNALIHGYDQIDFNRVWDVIHRELPPLITHLEKLLKLEFPQAD